VAEVTVTVPELKAAITQGELSISTARRIAPILNRSNQAEWIGKAKVLKQAELEKAVTERNPQAHPKERVRPVAKNVSELRVAIDDETDADLTILKDLLSQKLRRAATLGDVVAWAVKETREKFDPARKALRARKLSSGNAPEVRDSSAKALASASANPSTKPLPKRVPIPAAVRHEVVRAQGVQCSFTSTDNRRCDQRRWLDLHHRTPVALGGGNHAQNLMFLCSQHHRAVHFTGAGGGI
jgi:5-methylcytosine-specific restriction endonuclease McrA